MNAGQTAGPGACAKCVMLGEAGSGKSELAINMAVWLRRETDKPVTLFDLDQTKIVFRARDVRQRLAALGVTIRLPETFMDAPLVPGGVIEALAEPEARVILDVGGGPTGALHLGQFSLAVRAARACVFYVLNPYRSFSDDSTRIRRTMESIAANSGLEREELRIISNPYLGPATTVPEYLEGSASLGERLAALGLRVCLHAVPASLWEAVRPRLPGACRKIEPYLHHIVIPRGSTVTG